MKLINFLRTTDWRLLIACCAAFAMSMLFSALKPAMLTRFVEEQGLSQTLASLLVAMPFLGIAAAAPLLAGLVQRLPYRLTCVIFSLLLMGAEFISMLLVAHTSLLFFVQGISGISVGVLIGITTQQVAYAANRDAVFGLMETLAIMSMSAMVAGVGWSVERAGLVGGFGFASVCAVILCACVFFYRPREQALQTKVQSKLGELMGWRPLVLIAMGMLFITFSGLGFAYMFSFAKLLGFSYETAGRDIGLILFVSAFACAAGGWCAARFGHTLALAAAFIVCAISWTIVCTTTSPQVFLMALLPAVCALQFAFPVLLGFYGSLDREGVWAAVAASLLTSGFAFAAIVAGLVVATWGLAAIPYATCAGMFVCAALLACAKWLALREVKRG